MLRLTVVLLAAAVCAASALVIPTTTEDDVTCPVIVKPMDGFDPEQFFDGKHWYIVGGPASPQVACAYIDAKYSAAHDNVAFIEYITRMGRTQTSSFQLHRDANPAVYTYTDAIHNETVQMAIIDTDYTSYALTTQCLHGSGVPNSQSVYIFSRKPSPPDEYDDLVQEAKDQGYPVDEQHLSPTDTSACKK